MNEELFNPAELGRQSSQPQTPDAAKLDPVPWKDPMEPLPMPSPILRFTCPEFTSLCPVTGQPDFATIIIDYVPDKLLIESKSLKLFMGSFRNHPGFHEATTMLIARRFMDAADPLWMRVVALWYPRGGIPIDIFWQSGKPEAEWPIPEIDYKHYRGR